MLAFVQFRANFKRLKIGVGHLGVKGWSGDHENCPKFGYHVNHSLQKLQKYLLEVITIVDNIPFL